MAKTKPKTGPATAAVERQEAARRAELARMGLAKLQAGERLTKAESRAVKDWEAAQLAKWGPQYAAACPKGDYCDQVGIHQKVALEQSRRFGLPYHSSGPQIDLFAQLAAWHAWASANKHSITRMLATQQLADVLEEDGLEFWQRELVKEKAIRERDARLERQRDLLPRHIFHQLLQEFYAAPMRRRIELLERRDEPLAAELADNLRDDVKSFEEGLQILFAEPDDDGRDAEPIAENDP